MKLNEMGRLKTERIEKRTKKNGSRRKKRVIKIALKLLKILVNSDAKD